MAIRPPPQIPQDTREFTGWCSETRANSPWEVPSYTVASVPPAANWARSIIYVSNETGGATLAFSDGTNWRRAQDRAVIS
jgi:hypothetical protein